MSQEIHRLQTTNGGLQGDVSNLRQERARLVREVKGHLGQCHNSRALTRTARILAFSHRLLKLLDWIPPLTSVIPSTAAPPTTGHTAAPPPTGHTAAPPPTGHTAAPPPTGHTAAPPPTGHTAAGPPALPVGLQQSPRPAASHLHAVPVADTSSSLCPGIVDIRHRSGDFGLQPALHRSIHSSGRQQESSVPHQARAVDGKAVFGGRRLQIDVAAAAAFREGVERCHRRLQSPVWATASPVPAAPHGGPPQGRVQPSAMSPPSSPPPHASSQPATPTVHHPPPASLNLSAVSALVPASPLPIHPVPALSSCSLPVSPCSPVWPPSAVCAVRRGSGIERSHFLKDSCTPDPPLQAEIPGPQGATVRADGVTPSKDPALRSPVLPKKNPFLRLMITSPPEPSSHSPRIPKKDPALRSPVLPKKDPALRTSGLRSPTIPKKDPAFRTLVVNHPASSASANGRPAAGESGVSRRGPVGGGAWATPTDVCSDQLAPLNLSKRRRSEDLASLTMAGVGEAAGRQTGSGWSFLHTWIPAPAPSRCAQHASFVLTICQLDNQFAKAVRCQQDNQFAKAVRCQQDNQFAKVVRCQQDNQFAKAVRCQQDNQFAKAVRCQQDNQFAKAVRCQQDNQFAKAVRCQQDNQFAKAVRCQQDNQFAKAVRM
ncbi:hypothetical protein ACOMHN_025912 [Nucella lapillus]